MGRLRCALFVLYIIHSFYKDSFSTQVPLVQFSINTDFSISYLFSFFLFLHETRGTLVYYPALAAYVHTHPLRPPVGNAEAFKRI